MRGGLALLMTVLTLTACSASPEDIAQCRDWYRENTQRMSGNGHPGRAGFTPKMTARWNELYARSARLDGAASVEDCEEPLGDMVAEVTNLEAVLYKIDDYDVALMTKRAEARLERDDALRRATFTDYVLITLLRTMHERGAEAEKTLAPLVARVDAAKQDSKEQSAAMVALYNAAASNAAFADFKEALESIKNYDPDKE